MDLKDFKTKLESKKLSELNATDGVISSNYKTQEEIEKEKKLQKNVLYKLLKKVKSLTTVQKAIAIGLVVVIVLGSVVGVKLKSEKDSEVTFYDSFYNLVGQNLGSFHYRLTVCTAPTGEKQEEVQVEENEVVPVEASAPTEEVASAEAPNTGETTSEETTEETPTEEPVIELPTEEPVEQENIDNTEQNETTTGKQFVAWTDNVAQYWQYPSYDIIIDGCTMSTDPLTSKFTVTIAIDGYSEKFTEVRVVDGTTYVDVASMKTWLENSKQQYLMDLAEEFTDVGKYIVIEPDDFKFASAYAEDGEYDLSATTTLSESYVRLHMFLTNIGQIVENTLGNSITTVGTGSSTINIEGDNGATVVRTVRKNVGDFRNYWLTLADLFSNKNVMSESQYKQTMREIDNRDAALDTFREKLMMADPNDVNFTLNGEVTQTTTANDNFALEGRFNSTFTLDSTDYDVQVVYNRTGDTMDIVAPTEGRMVDIKNVEPNYFTKKLSKLAQYFEALGIETTKSLENTPANINDSMLQGLCDLVNTTGCYESYLTLYNVRDYIAAYYNYEDHTNANYIIVNDYLDALRNSLPSDVIVAKEDLNNPTGVLQFFDVEGQALGENVNISLTYNTIASDSKLKVWNLTLNSVDGNETFDLTKFNLRTVLSSKYPANSDVLLRSYGMKELDMLEKTIPNQVGQTATLYFVTEEDSGQMDLYYGDVYVCQLANY